MFKKEIMKTLTLEGMGDLKKKWFSKFKSFREAWDCCERGDWLLEFARVNRVDTRALVLTKALCTNLIRDRISDERSIKAIDTAMAYGKGEIDDTFELVIIAWKAYECCTTVSNANIPFLAYSTCDTDGRPYIQALGAFENLRKPSSDICREILTKYLFD